MTEVAEFTHIARDAPLTILMIETDALPSFSSAAFLRPFAIAAELLGMERVRLETATLDTVPQAHRAHIALLVGDGSAPTPAPAKWRSAYESLRLACFWGAIGCPVLWLTKAGAMNGARTALPRNLLLDAGDMAERAILTQHLYEIDGHRLSCCGGAAGIDFALALIGRIWGSELQVAVQDALYVDRVRSGEDRQRQPLQSRFGMLQPKLTEAVALMEANIEEPLSTDEIAALVGLSRRQLERQFRQFLDSVPSRYYLELRLARARALLLETNHSIVQVGLMCGFSSGSHFAATYGTHYGVKPRDERQRKLTGR